MYASIQIWLVSLAFEWWSFPPKKDNFDKIYIKMFIYRQIFKKEFHQKFCQVVNRQYVFKCVSYFEQSYKEVSDFTE